MNKRLKLKNYFPLIRTREEILQDISSKRQLQFEFDFWTKEQQEEFLDICTGMKGVKIVSDPFFKEIFNPEYTPERLDDLLSHLLKQKVKVLHVLPNDSVRLTAEGSLLITDLVVELEDGSIVNVEVQRIGYMFPGQRAACYSADLLLRQYRRVRDRFGKAFTYKKVKPVYTIVLFEKSPKEFFEYPENYIHYAQATTDTGLQMELLQKFVFIPLDIFKETSQNKPIKNKTEAWLTFLSSDEPERIVNLIEQYPEFKPMYDNIYELCRNVEGVMNMFSEELYILDRNTELYMMDEMQKEIDQQKKNLKSLEEKLSDNKQKIETYDQQLNEQAKQLDEQTKQLDEQTKQLDEQTKQLDEQTKQLDEQTKQLDEQTKQLDEQTKQLDEQTKQLDEQTKQLDEQTKQLDEQTKQLDEQTKQLDEQTKQLDEQAKQLGEQTKQLDEQTKQLDEQTKQLGEQTKQLGKQTKQIQEQARLLNDKDEMIKRLQEQLNDK